VSCGESPDPPDEVVEDPADAYRTDPRLVPLLRPRGVQNPYDVVTSDMLPRLIEKLEKGRLDPMKRAKEELGQMGAPAIPALRRLVERHYANAFSAGLVENALDAIAMNPAEEARPIVFDCLRHPQESVRDRAVRALIARHARPEDFDPLVARLDGPETSTLKKLVAMALHDADPARAEALYLSWLREDRHGELLPKVLPLLTSSRLPETARTCAELFRKAEQPWISSVAAPAARAGDTEALLYFDRALVDEDPQVRLTAAHAVAEAGLGALLAPVLAEDRNTEVRTIAANGLAQLEELTAEQHGYLTAAMDDEAPEVSAFALQVLAERGDPNALDRALSYLGEKDGGELRAAMLALRDPMERDPELARRAWDVARERNESEEHMPIEMRLATFKAIGMIPRPEAAELLHRIGIEHLDVELEGLRAHRWLMTFASNTGPPGRARLAELFEAEDDPRRRLDLIGAIGSARSDAVREHLQRITEETARSPYEALYAASILVNVGPARLVADRLQRVYYKTPPGEAFDAFEALLWEWY